MELTGNPGSELEEQLVGQTVREHVVNKRGLLLVPEGSVLDRNLLELLMQHKFPLDEIKTDLHPQGQKPVSRHLVEKATGHAKDLFERIGVYRKVPFLEIKNELLPLVQEAAAQTQLFELFEAVKAQDEYTHRHNIGVGVLAALMGNWLKWDPSEAAQLTLAATLHDLGKVKIPKEILQKPDKLTAEEYEEIKKHTIYGYEMLKETIGVNQRIALAALQHHERVDGTGYPLKLNRSQVDPFSRIIAVADVFHAMSSNRPYQEAMPFFEVVKRMRQCCFGVLDPYYVSVFLKNIIRSLVGQKVILTDGRLGEVVYINPHEDTTPLVKIEHTYLDLSKERHIQIDKVIA